MRRFMRLEATVLNSDNSMAKDVEIEIGGFR